MYNKKITFLALSALALTATGLGLNAQAATLHKTKAAAVKTVQTSAKPVTKVTTAKATTKTQAKTVASQSTAREPYSDSGYYTIAQLVQIFGSYDEIPVGYLNSDRPGYGYVPNNTVTYGRGIPNSFNTIPAGYYTTAQLAQIFGSYNEIPAGYLYSDRPGYGYIPVNTNGF